ncbi:hypothetical protein BB559_001681 [Furculomyces boomerangus]|uniref:Ornithine aminotransferase n=2 Tax=Harpellales TaxID=61421 RepID=A0A2T9XZY4_9FUNG|nr:hypothetical protein BB559_006885 [Furculomyces boomerangus]PVU98313.1 hypothetical protein BB559_001681 [Furculomyces boomerangus]PVZ97525.1 hypothetical protein BB558_006517 [Smittium angustum]
MSALSNISRRILSSKKYTLKPFSSLSPLLRMNNSTFANITSEKAVSLENEYGAHNYHPLPVVLSKGSGPYVWNPEGVRFYDFLSAYSAVNQGHCHPRIVDAMIEQAKSMTLSSRAFYNDKLGAYEKFVTEYFGYEMVLPMNTGVEAVETALKLSRRWAYDVKGVPINEAIVLSPSGNFHGRSLGAISLSTDEDSRHHFGPFVPNIGSYFPDGKREIRYNHAEDLEEVLEMVGDKVAAFIVEPVQGEAGVVFPSDGYLKKVAELCKKHNVLFIADEIQSGLGRTGYKLAIDHDGLHPDIVLLGKALSGGVYPVSAVLSSKEIMLTIKPGEHGSTYGGNPIACATAVTALKVLEEEKLCENSAKMGALLIAGINKDYDFIKEVRGRGLFCAIEVNPENCNGKRAWDLCLILRDLGLLCKPTHDHIIRLAPPLCINEEQINECIKIINTGLDQFASQ